MKSVIRVNEQLIFPGVIPVGGDRWMGEVALGNMTQYKICVINFGSWLVIAINERGCYEFDSFAHWTYTMEKLRIGESDAKNVSDFINDQLRHQFYPADPPSPRQGYYYPRFTAAQDGGLTVARETAKQDN